MPMRPRDESLGGRRRIPSRHEDPLIRGRYPDESASTAVSLGTAAALASSPNHHVYILGLGHPGSFLRFDGVSKPSSQHK